VAWRISAAIPVRTQAALPRAWSEARHPRAHWPATRSCGRTRRQARDVRPPPAPAHRRPAPVTRPRADESVSGPVRCGPKPLSRHIPNRAEPADRSGGRRDCRKFGMAIMAVPPGGFHGRHQNGLRLVTWADFARLRPGRVPRPPADGTTPPTRARGPSAGATTTDGQLPGRSGLAARPQWAPRPRS
jgi:hypothetical protein